MSDDVLDPDTPAVSDAPESSVASEPVVARRRRSQRWKRPPWWMFVGTAVGLVAVVVAATRPTSTPLGLRVADIPAAVAAVEQRTGGPQRYSEIKAGADGVNVFVVVDDTHDQVWFFDGHTLQGPGDPEPIEGRTPFTVDVVKLDVAPKLARFVLDHDPQATLVDLTLLRQGESVIWAIAARSPRGGRVESFFTADGVFITSALN